MTRGTPAVWDLYAEIQDKVLEKNIFSFDAMTLKGIHETVEKVRWLADRHYIDSNETEEDIGAEQEDCKCSAKRRISMKKRIVRFYKALLKGEIVDY